MTATGPQTNVARLTALDQFDSNPGNDQAAATVEGQPLVADLRITKTDHGTGPGARGPAAYTLVVTNQGPSAVTGARVVDPVPRRSPG